MRSGTPTNPTPEDRTADLARTLASIRTTSITAMERTHWRNHLLELLPDPFEPRAPRERKDAAAFIEVCEHLYETSRGEGELQELILALVEAQQDVGWNDPLLDAIDAVTERVVESLYDSLAPRFAASTDPVEAGHLYERLRDHCFGCDDRIIALAAASPHVTGRRIVLDFDESVIEHAPAALVRKLEKEGEHGFLLAIIDYGTNGPNILLSHLERPGRLVEIAIARAAAVSCELPLWLWESDVFFRRFDLLRGVVPWCEIEENADRPLWALIEEHLRRTLGENPEHWETFRALGQGFPGTLDELLDAARLL